MKQFSEETRAKMSEKAKLRCADPEWLKKQHERATKLPIDIVTSMYRDGHTQLEIANVLGVSQKVIWRFMKNHGIKLLRLQRYGSGLFRRKPQTVDYRGNR